MKKVVIRRCPVCDNIGRHAQELATTLRRIQGLDVEVVDGHSGEFTVLLDSVEIAGKGAELPSVEQVMMAIKDVALAEPSV